MRAHERHHKVVITSELSESSDDSETGTLFIEFRFLNVYKNIEKYDKYKLHTDVSTDVRVAGESELSLLKKHKSK